MDDDTFYSIRTAYYIGDYVAVEREAKNLNHLTKLRAKERDSYLCRAYIAQNKFSKADAISGKTVATPLLAVKQLSIYKQSQSEEERELVIETLQGYLSEEAVLANESFCVVASQIMIEHGLYLEALQLLVNDDKSLEKLLMQLQLYLNIYRHDLAFKIMQKMQDLEDDDPLTQIANIALCLYHGGPAKVKEALELLDDLVTANNQTVQLVSMMAVANMHLSNYSEAWKLCKQAKDLANDRKMPISTATLINTIICLQNLNKGYEVIPKLMEQLESIDPEHAFLRDHKEMSVLFDKSAQNFKL